MMESTHISHEEFSFIINSHSSSLPITELLTYLSNYEELVKSVNHVMNRNGGCGYDQIVVEVVAFQKGSFEIKGRLKKLSNNPTFAAISSGIVITLLGKALSNDPSPTVVINNSGGEVIINYSELVADKGVVESRSRIARTAVLNPDVQSISLQNDMNGEEQHGVEMSMDELRAIIVNEEEEDKNDEIHTMRARLQIIAPVLVSEPANWRFLYDGKKIPAMMKDRDFLAKMNETKIAFGKGDIIEAELETHIFEDVDHKRKTRYSITKVYSYPHYSANDGNQLILFE